MQGTRSRGAERDCKKPKRPRFRAKRKHRQAAEQPTNEGPALSVSPKAASELQAQLPLNMSLIALRPEPAAADQGDGAGYSSADLAQPTRVQELEEEKVKKDGKVAGEIEGDKEDWVVVNEFSKLEM